MSRERFEGEKQPPERARCGDGAGRRRVFSYSFSLFSLFSLFFASSSTNKRIESKTNPRFFSIAFSLCPAFLPLERRTRVFSCPSARFQKQNSEKPPALSSKHRSIEMMADANDTLKLVAALDNDDGAPLTTNDLSKELLVLIFVVVGNDIWVSHTVPRVCKGWAELYRLQDASPLHETLVLDFEIEVKVVVANELAARGGLLGPIARAAAQEPSLRLPVVHASRVFSWVERCTGWVRELYLKGVFPGAIEDFSSEDFSRPNAPGIAGARRSLQS